MGRALANITLEALELILGVPIMSMVVDQNMDQLVLHVEKDGTPPRLEGQPLPGAHIRVQQKTDDAGVLWLSFRVE